MFRHVLHCRPPLRLISVCALLLALTACGQKGPLYLPDDRDEDKTEERASGDSD